MWEDRRMGLSDQFLFPFRDSSPPGQHVHSACTLSMYAQRPSRTFTSHGLDVEAEPCHGRRWACYLERRKRKGIHSGTKPAVWVNSTQWLPPNTVSFWEPWVLAPCRKPWHRLSIWGTQCWGKENLERGQRQDGTGPGLEGQWGWDGQNGEERPGEVLEPRHSPLGAIREDGIKVTRLLHRV